MKKISSLGMAIVSLAFIGAGCKGAAPELQLPTTPPETTDVMMKKDETNGTAMNADGEAGDVMMKKDETNDGAVMPAKKPYYVAYTAEGVAKALAEGRPVMLYFYASWCPICRAEDPKIKQWTEGASTPIAGFRVDYTTEKALNEKYKIPYQHTTVFLNGKGVEVERFTGPMSQSDFEAAFAKASK